MLEELLDANAHRPANMSWYLATALLRRAPAAFRRQEDRWPTRGEAMPGAAQAALNR